MNGVHIRQADGGYIIDVVGRERIATTLDEVLNFLLLHFEGREEVTIDLNRLPPVMLHVEPNPAPAQPDPAPEKPRVFMCPICYQNNFKRRVGVIGHAYSKHGQTLTANDIEGSIA